MVIGKEGSSVHIFCKTDRLFKQRWSHREVNVEFESTLEVDADTIRKSKGLDNELTGCDCPVHR